MSRVRVAPWIRAMFAALLFSAVLAMPAMGASVLPPLESSLPSITLVSDSGNVVRLRADSSAGAVTLTASSATITVRCSGAPCAGVLGAGTSMVTLPAGGNVADVTVTLATSGGGVPSLTAKQGGASATVSVAVTTSGTERALPPPPPVVMLPSGGLSLFVFSGGHLDDLPAFTGCPLEHLAVWATDGLGEFLLYVPGSAVAVVNHAFRARFAEGVVAARTPMIGRCG